MQVQLPVFFRVCDPQLTVVRADGRSARTGGKPAAKKLLRPVKATGKRAKFLKWFLDDATGRTVGATMANFKMKRPNVFAYWTMIHRDHGIGYALSENTITPLLPKGCDSSNVFGGNHGA